MKHYHINVSKFQLGEIIPRIYWGGKQYKNYVGRHGFKAGKRMRSVAARYSQDM